MKFSIVANPNQSNMKKILTKVIGFVEDFDLEEKTAKIVGLKGKPITELQGDIVISLGGDGTLLHILSNLNKPVLELIAVVSVFLRRWSIQKIYFQQLKD